MRIYLVVSKEILSFNIFRLPIQNVLLIVSRGDYSLHSFEIVTEEDRIDVLSLIYSASRFHQMFFVLPESILKLAGHIFVATQDKDCVVAEQVVESWPGIELVNPTIQVHTISCRLAVHVKRQKRGGHISVREDKPLGLEVLSQASHFMPELDRAAADFLERVHIAGKWNQAGYM